jgi:hypothetical protein
LAGKVFNCAGVVSNRPAVQNPLLGIAGTTRPIGEIIEQNITLNTLDSVERSAPVLLSGQPR